MHEIEIPVFKGPLDLLLHLIEKQELDITAVSLVQVTDQYMATIRAQETIDLAAYSDFIAIGSKLLFIKSRALLPIPVLASPVDEATEEDVAGELVEMLEQYRRFKLVADQFRERQARGLRSYPRMTPPPRLLPAGLGDVTIDRLVEALQEALSRQEPQSPVAVIERDPVTVESKVAELLAALSRPGTLPFRTFIRSCKRPVEVVVSFLAVLELIKAGRVVAFQDATFGEIALKAA